MKTRENPASQRAAFTLIEIMLVVVIIALIMGMGVPSLIRGLRQEGMRSAVNTIMDACNKARASAIMTGKPADLKFTPGERKVDAPGFSATLPDTVNLEMLDVNFSEYKTADSAVVHFFPNGRCDDMTIILSSARNEWKMISLDITTAIVTEQDFHR
jgi:prepilin-type N-terminal cleavage/methylation domain-containing protein